MLLPHCISRTDSNCVEGQNKDHYGSRYGGAGQRARRSRDRDVAGRGRRDSRRRDSSRNPRKSAPRGGEKNRADSRARTTPSAQQNTRYQAFRRDERESPKRT